MKATAKRVLIVGGGLAALSCAIRLHRDGALPLILESSDKVGGRVNTDLVDGFRLDRGFQVFLDSYPEAGSLLDRHQLNLRPFRPGALVFADGKMHRVMDVFREPMEILASAIAPVGSVLDKLRIALLRLRMLRASIPAIAQHEDLSTEAYLRRAGFSPRIIDVFFRSFYGGIFLERDLCTSSRMFEFTFKMFSEGNATLPAMGMGEIPRNLASKLPPTALRLKARVASIEHESVTLDSGERLRGDAVVVATDAASAAALIPHLRPANVAWNSVTCVYFSAPQSPLNEAIIVLNGTGSGLVNNVCVPSDVSADYAPPGLALISVSVLGMPDTENLESKVLEELEAWFGRCVHEWKHLRTDRIARALPAMLPGGEPKVGLLERNSVLVCGDHCWSSSIEGAIISGQAAADELLKRF
jgi:phytoene dehydrogenase-like protein